MSDCAVPGPLPRRASACEFIKHCATLGTRRLRCQRARGHAAAPKLIPAKNGLFFFNYSGFIGQSNFDLESSGGPLALCGITYWYVIPDLIFGVFTSESEHVSERMLTGTRSLTTQ